MRRIVFLLCMILVDSALAAPSPIARFKYEDAEAAFAKQDYQTALTRLNEAEQEFGKLNPLILYLRIMARYELVKEAKGLEFDSLERLQDETAQYMKEYGNLESVQDKAREVYRVMEELRQYPSRKEHQARLNAEAKAAKAAEAKRQEYIAMLKAEAANCSYCPEMVLIPAGSFDMGSPDSEAGHDKEEGPVHRVTIAKPFAMGRTEITRGQFGVFVKETGYAAVHGCVAWNDGGLFNKRGLTKRDDLNWRNPGYAQDDNHPVVCISKDDAQAYAEWLTKKTGKQYRLPSEAEWEYAARAGSTTARYWSDNPDQACSYANVLDDAGKARLGDKWESHRCNDGFAYTAPVGSFNANAFGLSDMLGNVEEWVGDSYHDNYDAAPTNGRVWQGNVAAYVLMRGGSWLFGPEGVRSAYRRRAYSSNFGGMRLARTIEPSGWFGVVLQDEPQGSKGAVVVGMAPDGAASEAGIRVGDKIIEMNGAEIADMATLVGRIGLETAAGTEVSFMVVRQGESKIIRAKMKARPVGE